MDSDLLADIIGEYEYSKRDWAQRDIGLLIDEPTQRILLKNAYRHEDFARSGLCSEITMGVRQTLMDTDEFIVMYAIGTDERYFQGRASTHSFPLVTEKHPFGDTREIWDASQLSYALSQDPYVVDVSLGIIKPYSKTSHQIRELKPHGTLISYSNDHVLRQGRRIPLGFDGRGDLVRLQADFSTDSFFRVVARTQTYSLSHALDVYRNDAHIAEAIGALQEVQPEVWTAEVSVHEGFL